MKARNLESIQALLDHIEKLEGWLILISSPIMRRL